MDRITEALLTEFSRQFSITNLPEDERFENFVAWLITRRYYSETTFNPSDLVTGKGNDTGIDSIAVIANNNLITDVDTVDDLLEVNGYLDVTFVFCQAKRTPHFDSAKIGSFGFGVRDFFGDAKLPCNDIIQNYLDVMNKIYQNSPKFRPYKPSCYLYYVTTGTWNNNQNLVTRANAEI